MSAITLPAGQTVNGVYQLRGATLEVVKNESRELAYNLAVNYLGRRNEKVYWGFEINGLAPKNLLFSGSVKLVFSPDGTDAIRIDETDEKGSEASWVDLSARPYTSSNKPIVVNPKIKELAEKSINFEPADLKVAKKVFYDYSLGVFVYASDINGNEDLYFAKEDGRFEKCEIKEITSERCPNGSATLEVKLPGESDCHKLKFVSCPEKDARPDFATTWDKSCLKVIDIAQTCICQRSFEKGKDANGQFRFSNAQNELPVKVEICKKELDLRSYKLTVKYLGVDKKEQRPAWQILINDQVPKHGVELELSQLGSRKFEVFPINANTIQVNETDENGTESLWIDISQKPYTIGYSPNTIEQHTKQLLEKAKAIARSINTDNVFYHNDEGVIIYKKDSGLAIYHADKESPEFVKCEAKRESHARCANGYETWKVTLPNGKTHSFNFQPTPDRKTETTWDDAYLKFYDINKQLTNESSC